MLVLAGCEQNRVGLVSPRQAERFKPGRFPEPASGELLLDSAGDPMNRLDKRMKPMRGSAVRFVLRSGTYGALPLMAHPQRSARFACF